LMKFNKLAAALPRVREQQDPAALMRDLIKATTADEAGRALDQALAS
jgi:hypothetical protein